MTTATADVGVIGGSGFYAFAGEVLRRAIAELPAAAAEPAGGAAVCSCRRATDDLPRPITDDA